MLGGETGARGSGAQGMFVMFDLVVLVHLTCCGLGLSRAGCWGEELALPSADAAETGCRHSNV